MSIANRKSNGFIESPKIIDEQNVLKSTSTSKLTNTNVKMKREIVPDFTSALPHWPVQLIKYFRELKVGRMVALT